MNFDPQAFITSITTWPFMSEPIWRWAIFILALMLIITSWKGVLRHMEGVVA